MWSVGDMATLCRQGTGAHLARRVLPLSCHLESRCAFPWKSSECRTKVCIGPVTESAGCHGGLLGTMNERKHAPPERPGGTGQMNLLTAWAPGSPGQSWARVLDSISWWSSWRSLATPVSVLHDIESSLSCMLRMKKATYLRKQCDRTD